MCSVPVFILLICIFLNTLFYFESRGITKEQAENILARRGVDRVLNMIDDEETKEYVNNRLTEVM